MSGTKEESGHGTAALLDTLKILVDRSGRSIRSLEKELELGNGTLRKVFTRQSELRLRHVELLARALEISFPDLLAKAFPAPVSSPRSRFREAVAEGVRNEMAAFWRRHALRLEGSGVLARVEEVEPD